MRCGEQGAGAVGELDGVADHGGAAGDDLGDRATVALLQRAMTGGVAGEGEQVGSV